jgi:hypothetical protein
MTPERLAQIRLGFPIDFEEKVELCDLALAGLSAREKLWLWKNFVDGRPEYWAFDNPYPCHPNGDPMVLGSPCGYALVKKSENHRPEVSDAEVLDEIRRSR